MSKDALYFSHDSNARNDDKILKLRMKHDWQGYGLYWAIIERLREATNYMSLCDYNLIAYELRVDASLIKSIINDFGLFKFTDDKLFYSERLIKTMEIKEERSNKARLAANSRWSNANAMQAHSEGNASKGKVSKGKVSKEEPPGSYIPSLDEVEAYFLEHGYRKEIAWKAYSVYNASVEDNPKLKYWRDSRGNMVRNWKQKMQSVWFTEENKIVNNPGRANESAYEVIYD